MFLTRLLLNSRSPEVRRDLGDVHDMHRRVLTGYPDQGLVDGARREYQTLYRLEVGTRGGVSLLVQSEAKPDWSRLPEHYLEHSFEPNPAITELGPLLARLQVGQRLRFRLRANTTKRLRGEAGVRGKRIELVGEERLVAWLCRKAAVSGFELAGRDAHADDPLPARYRVSVTEEAKARGRRGGGLLTFGSTLFDGELVVTESQAFAAALRGGLGAAKAYGFGLLSVAPV
jgi:CRISPR system Cascade subunit CasE